MKLKLTTQTNEGLKQIFQRILVTASIIVQRGNLPTNEEINEPDRFGRYPYKDEHKDNTYQLCGSNSDWLNVREETDNYIIFEFNFRYDGKNNKKNTMSNVILTWFENVEILE